MPFGFISNETQVNSTASGNQRAPSTTALTNGGYVTVWASDTGDGSGKAIMGQLFDSSGNKVGAEFLVNTTTAGDQDLPTVVSYTNPNGPAAFIVVWQSAENGGSVIRGRRFDEDGTPVSFHRLDPAGTPNTDVLVSGNRGGSKPVAGMYGGGRLGIVWETPGGSIAIAKYTHFVPGFTPEILSTGVGLASDPQVSARSGGGLNVIWESQDPGGDVIRGKVVLQAGATNEVIVAGAGANENESLPNVASSGMAIWNSGTAIKTALLGFFSAEPQAVPVTLNTVPSGVISRSDIVTLSDGSHVVVYFTQSGDDGSSYSIRAERVSSTGQSSSAEILVPEKFTGTQEAPSVVQLANGNIVISWASEADALGNFEIKQRLMSLTAGEFSGDSGDNVINGTEFNDVFFLQQGGNDTVNGLGGDDVFIFGAALTSQDAVDGGPGGDRIEISGDYTGANALTLGAGIVNVETLVLVAGNSYHVTTVDANVTGLQVMEFNGSQLGLGQNFTFRGGAESTGSYRVAGGLGVDDFVGGAGQDVFLFENNAFGNADLVDGGAGDDTLSLRGNYTINFGAGQLTSIEKLQLGSQADLNGFAGYNYTIVMDDSDLPGGTLEVNAVSLRQGEKLIFFGDKETDGTFRISGGAGNDFFASGRGADYFHGGGGSDTIDYRGAVAGMIVTLANEGEAGSASDGDELRSVENVHGTAFADSLTGNSSDNRLEAFEGNDLLVGGAGNDFLYGGAGADQMEGGLGNDFYTFDDSGDSVIELFDGGLDTVATSISYGLRDNIERLQAADLAGTTPLWLGGNGLNNTIWGNAGDNIIDGGAGADYMLGGSGNDSYTIDNAGDIIVDHFGNDTVATSINYLLPDNIENLQASNIAGTAPLTLRGNGLNNFIWGNQGNNYIDGVGGADFMIGYGGDDVYIVDNTGDIAYEEAGGGSDTVGTWVSFTLGANIENLQAAVTWSGQALHLTGNSMSNYIWGTQGNDVIDGAGGADVMIGYGGNDIYFVDNSGDVTLEEANGGSDTVAATADHSLAANIENLQAANIGGSANLALTGNEQGNFIWGTQGNNVLAGRGGNDRIFGYGGADQFLFNTAAGAANADWLDDFQAGVDKIALDNEIFTALADGALPSSAFVTGTAAADADDRIIFDSATGSIFYDADGSGAGSALLVAIIPAGQPLTASDFLVV